jgi:co-chaperonin GroES (HSP10)
MKWNTFTPIGDNVLASLDARRELSGGGIVIPEVAREAEVEATICATGKDAKHLKQGDRVLVLRSSGTCFVRGKVEYVIISESKIRATVTEDALA